MEREKGRDLTQSYDKSPYTNRNVKRAKWTNELIKEGRTNERASECIVLYYNGMYTRSLLQDLSDIQM